MTFLWSTSYILNKLAFAQGIKPMTLAGLRYALAAMTLALFYRRSLRSENASVVHLRPWQYVGLGVAGYLVAQGFQYIGQYYVTPTQSGMVLSVGNTLLVLLLGVAWLREIPGLQQSIGMVGAFAGAALYYYPWGALSGENMLGIAMILVSGLGYAIQLTANRRLLQQGLAGTMDLVLYPMLVGAVGMLAAGLLREPFPAWNRQLTALLLWLGPINGGLAFFLWTYSQKVLQAFESSALNNTILLQIALMDAMFFDRPLGVTALVALAVVGVGILMVQLAPRKSPVVVSPHPSKVERLSIRR